MKKLTYILFILLITFYSCDSFLDVRPTGEVVNNELFETAEGYEEALYGVYSFLAREPLYGKNMTYGFSGCCRTVFCRRLGCALVAQITGV